MEQNKDIAKIERQLAALSGDNSASAMAKRRQLEAELAEAKAGLEETYYERSISDQQEALDKELETFQEEKDAEIEALENSLKNTEQIITDSMNAVETTGSTVLTTLTSLAEEYGVKISDALTKPWNDASTAIKNTAKNINDIEADYDSDIDTSDTNAANEVDERRQENVKIESAEKYVPPPEPPKPAPAPAPTPAPAKSISVGGLINAKGAKIYDYAGDKSGENQYFRSDPIYKVLKEQSGYLQVRWHKLSSGITGWFKKADVKAYAKGSKRIDENQLALIDELGEELVLHAGQNGRLQYLSKGSGVVPADLTSNLMDWGELNPQDILNRNRPTIGASPEVHATEINLNIQYGDMLKIENFKGDNPEEIAKIVAKQFEKHTAQLNQSLRKYVR